MEDVGRSQEAKCYDIKEIAMGFPTLEDEPVPIQLLVYCLAYAGCGLLIAIDTILAVIR